LPAEEGALLATMIGGSVAEWGHAQELGRPVVSIQIGQ
jgi:hypothetical protein